MTLGYRFVEASRQLHGQSFVYATAEKKDEHVQFEICLRDQASAKKQIAAFLEAGCFTGIGVKRTDTANFIVKARSQTTA